jgi:hypothetical protein
MTAADLLTALRNRGLTVSADGDALVVQPRELLTDELRAAIRAHKRDLLAELPRYRWLILEADGRSREVCCLPAMPRSELAVCYPGARLSPLPDSATEAGKLIHERMEMTA